MKTTELYRIINLDYQKATMLFGENRVLGTFLSDKGSIDSINSQKDVNTVTIIFPSIQDIAINSTPINTKVERSNGGFSYQLDFRLALEALYDDKRYIEDIFFTIFSQVNSMYQKVFAQTKEKVQAIPVSEWFPIVNATEITSSWTTLFEHYLQSCRGDSNKIFDNLTPTEERALVFCLEEIGDEGTISVSQAIRKSGISRPVFTSLFDKLARYNGAEIKNMGVKGTYINFSDHVLRKFDIS